MTWQVDYSANDRVVIVQIVGSANIQDLTAAAAACNQDLNRAEDEFMMPGDIEKNLGPQPIGRIMTERHLRPHDLVAASTDQITHKMVARACKGRRLTRHVQVKIQTALNRVTDGQYSLTDLFTY
jgi:hypothetical protein